MACTSPITGYLSRYVNPNTGKRRIVFDDSGLRDRPVQFPCGQCISCRMKKSREWAARCVLEASLWSDNIFLTLTYDDTHLPTNGSLDKRALQLFFKRLRKVYGPGIRYFAAGEYGTKSQRPHYHAIIFNFRPPDGEILSTSGRVLYLSPQLCRLWPFGFHSYGSVTYESASYVAKYCIKKLTGPMEEDYGDREPEFLVMSRRPGIAHNWLLKYFQDVYPKDQIVIKDKVLLTPPKYFDTLYSTKLGGDLTDIIRKRKAAAQKCFMEQLELRGQAYDPDFVKKIFAKCWTDLELWDENRYRDKFLHTSFSRKEEKL